MKKYLPPGRQAAAGKLPDHPTRNECLRLLVDRNVPLHIRKHCRVVAKVSTVIASGLVAHGGLRLDLGLLESAALLHDMAKADSLGRPLMDHAQQAGAHLRDMGYNRAAKIVEQHIYVREDACRRPLAEEQILCYADKRVLHDRIVSINERYQDLVTRYGTTPRLAEVIAGNRVLARNLEERIFALLPYPPECLEAAAGTG